MVNRKVSALAGAVAALLCAAHPTAMSETVVYSIVQNQSQINLTAGGSILGGALTVTEQQPSAITRYSGTIGAEVVAGGPDFYGAGSANAVNPTGSFSIPLQYSPNVNGGSGTAPANYGVTMTAPVSYDLPAITIPPEIIAQFPILPSTLDLGVLSAVVAKVALRDVALQITSTGLVPTTAGVFDANATSIDIIGGFADINVSARLTQSDLLTKLATQAILTGLASSLPELGITVSSPSLFSLDIDLGLGFRQDLGILPATPNLALTDGTISGLTSPPGLSTLVLPVSFSLDAGLSDILGPLADILQFDLQLDFDGSLRATATIPETSTIIMMSLGSIAFAGAGWRRMRKPAA